MTSERASEASNELVQQGAEEGSEDRSESATANGGSGDGWPVREGYHRRKGDRLYRPRETDEQASSEPEDRSGQRKSSDFQAVYPSRSTDSAECGHYYAWRRAAIAQLWAKGAKAQDIDAERASWAAWRKFKDLVEEAKDGEAAETAEGQEQTQGSDGRTGPEGALRLVEGGGEARDVAGVDQGKQVTMSAENPLGSTDFIRGER